MATKSESKPVEAPADQPEATTSRLMRVLTAAKNRPAGTLLVLIGVFLIGVLGTDQFTSGGASARTLDPLFKMLGYHHGERSPVLAEKGAVLYTDQVTTGEINHATASDAKKELVATLKRLKTQSKGDDGMYLLLTDHAKPGLTSAYKKGQDANAKIAAAADYLDSLAKTTQSRVVQKQADEVRAMIVSLDEETATSMAQFNLGSFVPDGSMKEVLARK